MVVQDWSLLLAMRLLHLLFQGFLLTLLQESRQPYLCSFHVAVQHLMLLNGVTFPIELKCQSYLSLLLPTTTRWVSHRFSLAQIVRIQWRRF